MNIEFTNGATVNRVWKDGEGELLAAFQYDAHATQFAEALTKDETQPRDVSFAVLNHYKGTVKIYKQPEPEPIGFKVADDYVPPAPPSPAPGYVDNEAMQR